MDIVRVVSAAGAVAVDALQEDFAGASISASRAQAAGAKPVSVRPPSM